jgi:hypothetical protein
MITVEEGGLGSLPNRIDMDAWRVAQLTTAIFDDEVVCTVCNGSGVCECPKCPDGICTGCYGEGTLIYDDIPF